MATGLAVYKYIELGKENTGLLVISAMPREVARYVLNSCICVIHYIHTHSM